MKFLFVEVAWYLYSGVTLLFEHSPSRVSEIEHFEILGAREKINSPDDFS